MKILSNKRIILGVTGGIATYKSADLARGLMAQGAEVQIVMTRGACEFVSPLTFQALTGRPVSLKLLDHDAESGMGHIRLARWGDLIVIAPATANFIAKLAHGMADDLLSTICLAADVPLLIAPAMNQQMWLNQATQENINTLSLRGVKLLGPAQGEQACGEFGPGRMLEPDDMLNTIAGMFATTYLSGTNILITAGPTREAIDPVRYISNHSSGRMGFAVAEAAMEADANVTLVSGPVSLQAPDRVRFLPVNTALQMQNQVLNELKDTDIFISTAAVADYRCAQINSNKIKSKAEKLVLELEKNPDILAEVAASQSKPFTVGFAAETESMRENAQQKLKTKGLDMVAANQVGEGLGFETEDNEIEVLWHGGGINLGRASKHKLARKLIKIIADRYHEKSTDKSH
jgi:phosphopantothenoylcysteine decarboxylase / phosphopantothenate---cysteine ligase